MITVTGPATEWTLFDVTRRYGTTTLPFSKADQALMAYQYNGQTGAGNQRKLVDAHVRKLEKEMEQGKFTPTPVAAHLDSPHRKSLVVSEDGTFKLEVDPNTPLIHSDGGHRFAAHKALKKKLKDKLVRSKDEAEKVKILRWLSQIDSVPVTMTVYFDGCPQQDFVNLQLGRSVDPAHMLSLSVRKKMESDDSVKMAFELARLLHKADSSPFQNSVRFDSRSQMPLPVSTLCASGAADVATSLVGLARVGKAVDMTDAGWLAGVVVSTFKTLKAADGGCGADGILGEDKVLTPIGDGGSKGASTMLVGVSLCMAYRLGSGGKDAPEDEDEQALVVAAEETLDRKPDGNFSGPVKRQLLRDFAAKFFEDVECEKLDGVPTGLVKALSASAFGIKTRKARLPEIDGELAATA